MSLPEAVAGGASSPDRATTRLHPRADPRACFATRDRLLKEQPHQIKTVYQEASRLEYWRASFMKALKVSRGRRGLAGTAVISEIMEPRPPSPPPLPPRLECLATAGNASYRPMRFEHISCEVPIGPGSEANPRGDPASMVTDECGRGMVVFRALPGKACAALQPVVSIPPASVFGLP